jgi:hypothetical protein
LIGLALDRPSSAACQVFQAADERQYSLREWIEIVAAAAGGGFEFAEIPVEAVPLGGSALPMEGEWSLAPAGDVAAGRIRHTATSSEKARRTLGYRDAVEPEGWIRETVDHWLRKPPEGESIASAEFDYAAEDLLLRWWDDVVAGAPRFGVELRRGHAYDHPSAPSR